MKRNAVITLLDPIQLWPIQLASGAVAT